MTEPLAPSVVDRTAFLRVVSIYKFVQTAVLAALGLATLRLVDPAAVSSFTTWVQDLPVGYVQHVAERFLEWIAGGAPSSRVFLLGGALFAYAALFFVEAVGLWLQKRWAEWLTVVATATLIPPEIYECLQHPGVTLFVLLALNTAVVWLLAKRLRHELAHDAAVKAASADVMSRRGAV
jgi:uncharacterized membrane protein (DUF2068 family)